MPRTLALLALLALAGATAPASSASAQTHRIATASERGTYIQIGRDLARLVAQPAGIDLEAVPSKGSIDNVRRLRDEPGVRMALVQSDVWQAYMDLAQGGNAEAARLIRPLRVVLPLYDEEIYFVTHADSPLTYIHEIRGKRINVGPIGSGSALSATTLYRLMFGTPPDEQNLSYLSNEDALLKLATDRSIDVAVVVAGQPARLFAEMRTEARQFVKLLRLDTQAQEARSAMATYFRSSIRAASYPQWLNDDVPTLSTKALLVTYDFRGGGGTQQMLTRFARSLCTHFDRLRSDGHAKWSEVALELPPLGQGWSYYGPTYAELARCAGQRRMAGGGGGAVAACPQAKAVLGLCR